MPTWLKLDNAAKIYPPSMTRRWQVMFRLSVTLTEDVDPVILAEAQRNTLKRFPSFACRLRRGLFWFYLERMEGAPPVVEDVRNPMDRLDDKANGGFMYRLLYYRGRIAVEFFHTVTDGHGGMTFLMSLTNEYLRLVHGVDAAPAKYILRLNEEPTPEEYEDSFPRYAGAQSGVHAEQAAYQPTGSAVPLGRLAIICSSVPTDALRAKAKEYDATLGVFLGAVLLDAVYRHQQAEPSARKRRQPVKIDVPVNLRPYFPSKTLRNFSGYFNPGIDPRMGEWTFEEILHYLKHYLAMHVNEKELRAWLTYNVKAEQNMALRLVPLAIKNVVMAIIFRLQGDRYSSTTLSNFGRVDLPEEMAAYVDRIDFFLGPARGRRTNCTCVSFGGRTFIDFSRTMAEADIERRFFTKLVQLGIPVLVESNNHAESFGNVETDAGVMNAMAEADAAWTASPERQV